MFGILKKNKNPTIDKKVIHSFSKLEKALDDKNTILSTGLILSIQRTYKYRNDDFVNSKLSESFNKLAQFNYCKALGLLSHVIVNSGVDTEYRQKTLTETALRIITSKKYFDFESAEAHISLISMLSRGLTIELSGEDKRCIRDEWLRAINVHINNDDLYQVNKMLMQFANTKFLRLDELAQEKWLQLIGNLALSNMPRAKELAKITVNAPYSISNEVKHTARKLIQS